jgi:nicotinamidase-related amidase
MKDSNKPIDFGEHSREFLNWLGAWYAHLTPLALADAITDPARTAILSVDLINGFCYEGNLASARVASVIPAAVRIFEEAYARGVRHFILSQEWHSEHAEEFKAFAPHGIRNTREAETVPELKALPFANEFVIVRKNSIHTLAHTDAEKWLDEHPEVDTFLVVGDCTDLCVYESAMDLKLRANALDIPRRVIVPANAVNTYDLPVGVAEKIGALPHDGDLLHALFLYQMALNQIEVVREITLAQAGGEAAHAPERAEYAH